MSTMIEIQKLTLNLSEHDRAQRAANLLESLPGVLADEDDGMTEALRRDADLDTHPDKAISLSELDSQIKHRRG